VNIDTVIEELEAANPAGPPNESRVDNAWNSLRENLAAPEHRRVPQSARLAGALGILVAALVTVVVFQASPIPHTTPTASSSASAAPFLRRAAHAVLTAPTFNEQSGVIPQANQYVYSETEDPSGTLYQLWLSTNGNLPALHRYVSSSGDVIAPGMVSNAACTVAPAESGPAQSACIPEAGYLPDLPTDPTTLLAYLNQIGEVDTEPSPSDPPGQIDNELSSGFTNLMQTCYLLPAQRSALFSLMAQTPGFTIVPNMADAIGRVGVGVEWNFQGDSGALIFNPTTYALLGLRTWPGPPILSAPYDGDALLGISIVNSVPSTQTPPAT
jgi:hypothetical protein